MTKYATDIHATAIISPEAEIGRGVRIGPYSIVGSDVHIGDRCYIGPHVVIEGHTRLEEDIQVFQFASIGAVPQDLKYNGEPTGLEIGGGTIIRESVTIHRGTEDGRGVTTIGKLCMLMAYSHVAHDCKLGDNVILANSVAMGGHVTIGRHATIGGLCAIHQFCTIGQYAFMGGMSATNKDIPPFTLYWGQRENLSGLNTIGLRRHGFSPRAIKALRDAYRIIFTQAETITQGVAQAEKKYPDVPEVRIFTDFIKTSKRGIPAAGRKAE
jgi:UDP-N-acetylglucosamine acyltransferase